MEKHQRQLFEEITSAEQVAAARKKVGAIARMFGFDDDAVADLELVASELFTNALKHGTGRAVVYCGVIGPCLVIGTHNPFPQDRDEPGEQDVDVQALPESGRGLRQLVGGVMHEITMHASVRIPGRQPLSGGSSAT